MYYFILISQSLSILILFVLTVYIAQRKPSRIQIELLTAAISALVMIISDLVVITANCEEAALIGVSFSQMGKQFALMSSFMFIADYCRARLSKKIIATLCIYHALLTTAIFTNNYHHLFYSTVKFQAERMFSPLILGHGPLYFVSFVMIIVYLLMDLSLGIREYKKVTTKEMKQQTFFIFAMVFFAVGGDVVFLTGVTRGYDTTMTGIFVGIIILAVLFKKYRLFDTMSLAKEQALKNTANGVLVIDIKNEIIYANDKAKTYLKEGLKVEQIKEFPYERSILQKRGKIFEVIKNEVKDKGRYFGETVELRDITDEYIYSNLLEEKILERTEQIRGIKHDIVASLANIVEARDGMTGEHIKNTSKYVELIAKELRKNPAYKNVLTEDFVQTLVEVAPLHDLGKISIPDTILMKPEKLSHDEFEIIKRHTEKGAEVIEQIMRGIESDEYVSMAEEVALCHHEKWDGSGYPKGLFGEEIPISGRIMAVADVFDALCSERCYKKAISKKEAIDIICEGKGKHFDPNVVNAFLKVIYKMET